MCLSRRRTKVQVSENEPWRRCNHSSAAGARGQIKYGVKLPTTISKPVCITLGSLILSDSSPHLSPSLFSALFFFPLGGHLLDRRGNYWVVQGDPTLEAVWELVIRGNYWGLKCLLQWCCKSCKEGLVCVCVCLCVPAGFQIRLFSCNFNLQISFVCLILQVFFFLRAASGIICFCSSFAFASNHNVNMTYIISPSVCCCGVFHVARSSCWT